MPAVPVKSTTCGLPAAESMMVIWAVRVGGVIEVGAKVTVIVQLPRGGTEVPQVFVCTKSLASAPVTVTLVISRVVLAPLVRVTV